MADCACQSDAKLASLAEAVAAKTMALSEVGCTATRYREQKAHALSELAALPEPRPLPAADEVDVAAFREALVAAWHGRPVDERRQALDRMINEIELRPGEAVIRYSWKPEADTYHHQAPPGPP